MEAHLDKVSTIPIMSLSEKVYLMHIRAVTEHNFTFEEDVSYWDESGFL